MRIIRFVLIVAIAALCIGGLRWYRYVSNTETPYQEVGIELNSRLPAPIRKWGCDRLHATFGEVPPPYGCQAGADGAAWL